MLQPPDDERVDGGGGMVQRAGELGALVECAARLVGEDVLAAGRRKRIELQRRTCWSVETRA